MSPPKRDGSLPPKQEATAQIHFSSPPTHGHHTEADSVEHTPMGYGAIELREYVQAVYAGADARGWLHVGFGVEPYRNANGKITFRFWLQGSFRWPDAADPLLALLLEFAPHFDTYVCPYVLAGPRRLKHTSVARDVVHCDGDDGVDLERAHTIPGVYAERQLEAVAEAWDVAFTPDGEPLGVFAYFTSEVPLLGPEESGEYFEQRITRVLTKEEVATGMWLVERRDVPGGVSANELAHDFGIPIDVATLRLIGLIARDRAHEVSPGRYRHGPGDA